MTSQADRSAQAKMDEATDSVRAWTAENHAKGGVCDFCCFPLADVPEDKIVTYVTDPMVGTLSGIDENLGIGTAVFAWDPFWGACEACVPVIDLKDPAKLADHVLDNRHESAGGTVTRHRALLRDEFIDLYEKFFAGDPAKVDEATAERLTRIYRKATGG